MSGQFFALNTEERLADATAGSLALALAFLRPWFHSTIDNEDELGVRTLVSLAVIIAQWPSQSWMQERPEIYDLINAMASTLSRELREKHEVQVKDEVSRLKGVVDELHEVVREYEVKFSSLGKRPKGKRPMPTLFINSQVLSPPTNTVSLPVPPGPQTPGSKVQTPLTPPDTPRSSTSSASRHPAVAIGNRLTTGPDSEVGSLPKRGLEAPLISIPEAPSPLSAAAVISINAIANQSLAPKHSLDGLSSSPSNISNAQLRATPIALTPPRLHPQTSHAPSSALSEIRPEEIPLPPTPSQRSPIRPIHYYHRASSSFGSWTMVGSDEEDRDDDTQVDEDISYQKDLRDSITTLRDLEEEEEQEQESPPESPTLVMAAPLPKVQETVLEYIPPRPRSGLFAEPLELDYTLVEIDEEERVYRRHPGKFETAGCIIAGFLVGAVATMALLTPHRRMIIHLT